MNLFDPTKPYFEVVSAFPKRPHPTEPVYQGELIKRIKSRFKNCDVLKNDSGYRKGIPDLTVYLDGGRYAFLEVKASYQDYVKSLDDNPLQLYYIRRALSQGAYASYIYPEIEKEVLDELEQSLQIDWHS